MNNMTTTIQMTYKWQSQLKKLQQSDIMLPENSTYKSDSIGNTMISQKGVRSNKTKHQVNHRSSKAAGKQISVYEELLEKRVKFTLLSSNLSPRIHVPLVSRARKLYAEVALQIRATAWVVALKPIQKLHLSSSTFDYSNCNCFLIKSILSARFLPSSKLISFLAILMRLKHFKRESVGNLK